MRIGPYLTGLIDCICEELAAAGRPVCACRLTAGVDVPWQECGPCKGNTCGMAYVRVYQSFPYATFPLTDIDPTCKRPRAWALGVGIVRCWPIGDDEGNLPPPQVHSDATLSLLEDAETLLCCIRDSGGLTAVQSWDATGPLGGCISGEWTMYVDPSGR